MPGYDTLSKTRCSLPSGRRFRVKNIAEPVRAYAVGVSAVPGRAGNQRGLLTAVAYTRVLAEICRDWPRPNRSRSLILLHRIVFRLPVFFRHLSTTAKRYCAGKKLNFRRSALPKRGSQSRSHGGYSEISFIPRTFLPVAVVAEHLQVLFVQSQVPVIPYGLDVVGDDPDLFRGRAAALTLRPALILDLASELLPFRGLVEYVDGVLGGGGPGLRTTVPQHDDAPGCDLAWGPGADRHDKPLTPLT
jgi:hypothetical protein